MILQDKCDLFLSRELQVDREVEVPNSKQAAFLKNVLFEHGAHLDSPLLPMQARAFFGAYSYMNSGGYLRDQVFVGRYCSIGRRVTIGAGNHFTTGLSTSPRLSGGHANDCYTPDQLHLMGFESAVRKPAVTLIGSDVWIGDGAVVLPGLRVGHGVVIGANSVVTRDVPPYAVMGGTPARVLKYRFPPEQVQSLLDTHWWDHPREVLDTLPLGNILACLDVLKTLGSPPSDAYDTLSCSAPNI